MNDGRWIYTFDTPSGPVLKVMTGGLDETQRLLVWMIEASLTGGSR